MVFERKLKKITKGYIIDTMTAFPRNTIHYLLLEGLMLFLAACSASTPVPTVTPLPSDTPFPTETRINHTATPMATVTSAITEIAMPDMYAYVTGHDDKLGTMVCVKDELFGNHLNDLVLTADIYQDKRPTGLTINRDISIKYDNEICFDMYDGNAIVGEDVKINLIIKSKDSTKQVTNGKQSINAGPFKLTPHLGSFFKDNKWFKIETYWSLNHWLSYDFKTGNTSESLYAPCDGIVLQTENFNCKNDVMNSKGVKILCTSTNETILYGHTIADVAKNDHVTIGQKVGHLGKDACLTKANSGPHLHLTVSTVYSLVDPFNPHCQLGGDTLPYGLFMMVTMSDSFIKTFDSGKFKPHYTCDGKIIPAY